MRNFILMIEAVCLGALLAVLVSCHVTAAWAPTPSFRPSNNEAVVRVESFNVCGSAWALTDNLFVTCYHIVEAQKDSIIWIVNKDKLMSFVRVRGVDPERDVAVLEAFTPRGTFGCLNVSNDPLRVGQEIWTVGFPDCAGPFEVTGLVSDRHPYLEGFAETTMPTMPGASGSPVLDSAGNVVGMISRYYRRSTRAIIVGPGALREGIKRCLEGGTIE